MDKILKANANDHSAAILVEELYKIGSLTYSMISCLTPNERKRALFLYRLVYNPELPIELEDPVWTEIGKLWQTARDRSLWKTSYPSWIEQHPWYLQGKLSARQ